MYPDLTSWIPERLHAIGPLGLMWWQWMALPVVALVAGLAGAILGRITRVALELIAHRTTVRWDDKLIMLVAGPLAWLWGVLTARLVIVFLGLPGRIEGSLEKWLRTGTLLVFFWILFRLVSAVGQSAATASWASSRPSMRALVPLGVKIGRFAVAAIALVAVLADLDYKVTSLLAGLGIGGLALALAGQKTVENLFGAFSIGLDEPFSVGDTITVDGTTGTVEAIGLRSTRIRTLERTLITIPNGRLAEMKVESIAARDRIRFACVLTLVYSTTSAQVRKVVADVEAALRAQPKLFQEDVVVRLRGFATESLEIEVVAAFLTTDYGEFGQIRQALLLAFMEIVERTGTAFAFPTRTVHVVDEERRPNVLPSRAS